MLQAYIAIPSYKCIVPEDGTKSYHVYSIYVNVFFNGIPKSYSLERRYSDFLQLHNVLKLQRQTPEFPPKRLRNYRTKVLESRRHILEEYLQITLTQSPISQDVITFLEIPTDPREYIQSRHYERQDSHRFSDSRSHGMGDMTISEVAFRNPAAAFLQDPFLDSDSDSSSNLSDAITNGVLDALYR